MKNKYSLHKKRHNRQLKRKDAAGRARRRSVAQQQERQATIKRINQAQAESHKPGFLGRLLGGSQIGQPQPDAEAAQIETASEA